ncbi:MAG: hypothetical protein IJW89_01655, partial [Clostridia bacterium]|nr:hypothetical protein [Clostridia bacterium]
MKKVVSFVLAVAVIGVLLMMPAGADTTVTNCEHYGESVTALEDGFINILFSNGYRGFCIKYGLDEAAQSDAFTVDNMALAAHNTSGQNFANDLKVMFVDFFTELFTVDTEHLIYTIKDATSVQRIIWHFSDGYTYRVDRNFVNEVRSAAMARAEEIPDHGYTVKLNNTTTATFDFHVLRTPNSAQQNFWTYKVTLARFPAPQILTPEGDESVETALGESEELKITALYAEQYQWQVNTGSGFEDIDDATEPTYTTPVATEENKDFTYRCVVSNTAGSAESPVFSLKLPAPTTTTTTTTTAPTTTTTTTTTAPTTTTTTTTTAP